MKQKKFYCTPGVLKEVSVILERPLVDSIVNDIENVRTTGQEAAGYYDETSSTSFNHQWED